MLFYKRILLLIILFYYKQNSLFCSICLVNSSKKSVFISVEGFEIWVHVYERIKDHEESKNHRESSKYYMSDSQGESVVTSLRYIKMHSSYSHSSRLHSYIHIVLIHMVAFV
ncbi:hypothetical protein QTP88_021107 [Uroleucon formosanum]